MEELGVDVLKDDFDDEVRTLGVAHWEHELKKAYNVISCGNEKMCNALQGGINK